MPSTQLKLGLGFIPAAVQTMGAGIGLLLALDLGTLGSPEVSRAFLIFLGASAGTLGLLAAVVGYSRAWALLVIALLLVGIATVLAYLVTSISIGPVVQITPRIVISILMAMLFLGGPLYIAVLEVGRAWGALRMTQPPPS